MTQEKNDLLLNADELKLLSEVISANNDGDSNALEYGINCSAKGEAVLSQIGKANTLELSASYGNHLLVFPVLIENNDFSNLKMTLKPPEIFETGDTLRSWRLTTHKEKVYFINKSGDQLNFQIEDLSASGISFLIDPKTKVEFPSVLDNAFLLLPNQQKLSLSGLKISRIDDKRVAYSLGKEVDQAVLTSLYEYLFECHLKKYPDAFPN